MEKALIALSFDDGRLDNYTNAYPILKKYHLPATFNITSGYIDETIDRILFDFPDPMTIQMVRELFATKSFEIAGHGYHHINTTEDIIKGIKDLCRMLKVGRLDDKGNGFASPGSDLTEEMYKEMKPVLDANDILYVRISNRYKSFKSLKIFLRKVSRLVKWPVIYKFAYKDTLMDCVDNNIMYSIPVLSSVTPRQLRSLVLSAVRQKKACILMFHSVVPQTSIRNTWDFSMDYFEEVCKMLSAFQRKEMLEVKTVMDVYASLKGM